MRALCLRDGHQKPVNGMPQVEQHNYTNLAGTSACRDVALRRPNTNKVVMVPNESTPAIRASYA